MEALTAGIGSDSGRYGTFTTSKLARNRGKNFRGERMLALFPDNSWFFSGD